MADNKVNSGLLEFSEEQKVFVALDAETSEVKKAVTIDGDGVETDMLGVQPTGKKEITSTAEVNVASYATAQVVDEDLVAGNIKKDVDILGVVGSYEPEAPASDFSTAEVVITNSESSPLNMMIAVIMEAGELGETAPALISNVATLQPGANTVTVPLYKGALYVSDNYIEITASSGDITVTGATALITGNCAMTIGVSE